MLIKEKCKVGFFDIFKKEELTPEEKEKRKDEKQQILQEKAERAKERHQQALERLEQARKKIAVPLELIGGMPGLPKTPRLYKGENPGQIKIEKTNMDLLSYQWG